jgi:hypothetical protein
MNRIVTVLGIVALVMAAVLYIAGITSNVVIILGVVGVIVAIVGLATGR